MLTSAVSGKLERSPHGFFLARFRKRQGLAPLFCRRAGMEAGGEREKMARNSNSYRDSNRLRRGSTGPFIAGLLALFSGAANAAWELNLQEPVTAVARRVYELHSLLLWVIVVIFFVIFTVVAYSLVYHRKSKGHKAATFHANTTV